MTSPGQARLRELLVDAAAGVDPTVNWDKQRLLLLEIRAAVMSDPAITTDAITGQNLRLPAASPTYAAVQQAEIHGEAHPEWTIDADAVLYSTAYYYDPMLQEPPPACAGGDDPLVRGSPLACAGGAKALSTFGALTWLALGRALPTEHCPRPTLLTGSRIVLCDGAGVHRSLACFLWGAAPIGGRVTVIDDTPDDELHTACRLVESRLPEPGLGLLLNERDRAGCRGQLLELSKRLDQLPGPLTNEDLHAAESKLNPHHHPWPAVAVTATAKDEGDEARLLLERATATLENVTCAVELAEAAAAASRRRRWWRRLA